jgi:hypothetical protein
MALRLLVASGLVGGLENALPAACGLAFERTDRLADLGLAQRLSSRSRVPMFLTSAFGSPATSRGSL